MSIAGPVAAADWGDVPTWLTTVSALAAGALIFLIYLRAAERDRRLDADRQARADDDRRTQAAQVCGWYGRTEGQLHPQGSLVHVWGAFVRNASGLPIYDLGVEFHFTSPRMDGGVWTLARATSRRKIIPPGETFVAVPEQMVREVMDSDQYVVALSFRDAANRRWFRDPDGVLTEVRPPAGPAAEPV